MIQKGNIGTAILLLSLASPFNAFANNAKNKGGEICRKVEITNNGLRTKMQLCINPQDVFKQALEQQQTPDLNQPFVAPIPTIKSEI